MFIDPAYPYLPIPDALDEVAEVDGMITICAAQRLQRIHVLRQEALEDAARHGRELTEVIERGVRLELAARLRITEHAAGELIRLADALICRYPAVMRSFERAGMTQQHVESLVEALDQLEPELRVGLLAEAITLAEAQPVGTFRRALRKMIDAARAVTLEERHEQALTKRRFVIEPDDDGMSWLHAYLPSVEARAVHARATGMAKAIMAHEGETRTLDQTRLDVLCDLLIDGDTAYHPAESRGIRASVVVTVPALALLAENDATRDADGLAPAVVEGVGPISLTRAKELCGGAVGWMRVLTHPETGAVVSVGRDHYRPPAALARIARWRADRCMAPGCGIPASRCEIDHTVAWEDGGQTALDNLAPLCKGHHTVKHHGGWKVRQVPGSGGALEWTSPAGRRYVVQPERRMPVFRPSHAGDAPF
jgi:hypothetical protein